MNTQYLKTFIALCQYENFTRAADSLFVTQSTVTKRIAQLESEVNKKLFHRDKKHVELTVEGQVFLKYAQRIVELEEASIKDMRAYEKYKNYLRIGATNSIYECHIIQLISKYLQNKTNSIKITISHSSDLLLMLQDGIIDVAFVYYPFQKTGFDCIPFQTDELVLVTGGENCEHKKGIMKNELKDVNYLMCNFALKEIGTFIRELFPQHYPFSLEIDNSTKIIQYLINGTGYSFVPFKMVKEHIDNGKLRVIPLLDIQTPVIKSYYVGRSSRKQLWQGLLDKL